MRHFRGIALFYIIYLRAALSSACIFSELCISDQHQIQDLGCLLNLAQFLLAIHTVSRRRHFTILSRCPASLLARAVANAKLRKICVTYDAQSFYIDEKGIYQPGDGYTLHLVLIMIQLFGSGIYSFAQSIFNKQVKLRSEYPLPLLFIILPALAAVLEGNQKGHDLCGGARSDEGSAAYGLF